MGKKIKIKKPKKTFVVSATDGIYEINKPQDLSYGMPDKFKNYPVKIIKPTLNSKGGVNIIEEVEGKKLGGEMSCPHRPDGVAGGGAAIKGMKFTGVF